MKTADAHCDTLTKFKDEPFYTKNAAWNIKKFKKSAGILQYMAVFIGPPNHGDSAMCLAVNAIGNFLRRKPKEINLLEKASDYKENKINIILSLEGASPLIDEISNLHAFHKLGLRAITLTWNHRNFVADGVGVKGGSGLTDFGEQVVKEMEKLNMIIDVSHLNEAGFKDLCKIATKPFVASHSNAFDICPHARNLKKYQAREIINRKGFIGLNFYAPFIYKSHNKNILTKKFLEHVSYFLNLGAENILGIGADFDGMDESPFEDVTSYPVLAELLEKELKLKTEIIEKIMYKNLVEFTLKMI
ncbi:MAG: membrane dipeptidase [bacterium]